jgi:L-threonylcarbamoyladenylate synthase
MKVWDVRGVVEEVRLSEKLQEAAAALKQGGLVAFPTETVYGLGADATNEQAVRGIFAAKERPADNPLIVHIGDMSMLRQAVADEEALPAPARKAMEAFWPGPLTLILPAHPAIAPSVRPGMDTIGVRFPAHPVAQALIRLAGRPIAAPSANRSGKPSPTTAGDVTEDMEGRIVGVVDGGPCAVGVESTVVAIAEREAVIYRPGGVTREQLEECLGIPVTLDPHLSTPTAAPKAPGMKYRHYAPDASVHVWWGDQRAVEGALRQFCECHAGERIAMILPSGWQVPATDGGLIWTAPSSEPYAEALSRELYRLLREFDRAGAAHILVVGVPPQGLGAAVMNRLQKASEGRVHRV